MIDGRRPDKVTEPQNQDTNTRELHHTREIGMEGFHELWKHGRQR